MDWRPLTNPDEMPTMNEMARAIASLKDGKVPGEIDKIRLIHLLCGNFAVGLYIYIHTKINNSKQYHIKVQY